MIHSNRNSISEDTEGFKFILSICKDYVSVSTLAKNLADCSRGEHGWKAGIAVDAKLTDIFLHKNQKPKC